MNDVLKCLETRRSIKRYKSDPIPDALLSSVLEAGEFAPSGMGAQSPVFAAVTDKSLVEKLSRMNAAVLGGNGDPFYGAPAVIVVFGDSRRSTCVEDASLAIGNMLNAAHSLGLGSCWIHRATEVFETEEGRALKKQWGLGDEYIGIGHCILGYADGPAKERRPRKQDYIIHIQ